MSKGLDSEVAFVVGASSGIGRAVARRFGDEGADVVVGGLNECPEAGGPATHELIREAGCESMFVDCDLTDQSSVNEAIDTAVSRFGSLDIGFNCAGALTRGPITETSEEDMQDVVDVNLLGAMRFAKAILPELVETDGTLLTVSSEAGEMGVENLPAYCASKGGVNALTRQLAVEYGPEGVSVNALAPGTTKTPINEDVRENDPTWVEERRADIPLGRLNDPEDVANLAAFLASAEADTINGAIVNIDGGTTAR